MKEGYAKLGPTICEFIGLDRVNGAAKAARLAKADLSTMTVRAEFPKNYRGSWVDTMQVPMESHQKYVSCP